MTTDVVRRALAVPAPPADLTLDRLPPPLLPGPSPYPSDERVAPREAAVLCAVFDDREQAEVILTRRSAQMRSHTGEVSFPGGKLEDGEAPLDAALREASEEVGLDATTVDIVGHLSVLSTVINPAPITPFVGILPGRPDLRPNPAEVERVLTVMLAELASTDVYHSELWTFPGGGPERIIEFFDVIGDTIWGATARMLSDLLHRLSALPA